MQSGFQLAGEGDRHNNQVRTRHAYDIGEALQFVEDLEFSPRVPADVFLKEKRRKPVIQIQNRDKGKDSELVVAKGDTKWRLDPKGCFRIGICEVEEGGGDSDRKIYAEHVPTGKRIIGETAKEVMDTILRLGMVSMLEHASYLSIELTNAELALRLN